MFAEIRLSRKCANETINFWAITHTHTSFEKMTRNKKLESFYHTICIPCDSNSLSFLCSCDQFAHTLVRKRGNSCARAKHIAQRTYIVCKTDSSRKYEKSRRVRHTDRQSAFISMLIFGTTIFLFPFWSRACARWFVFFLASLDAQRAKLMNAAFIIFQTDTHCCIHCFIVAREWALITGRSFIAPTHNILSPSLTRNVCTICSAASKYKNAACVFVQHSGRECWASGCCTIIEMCFTRPRVLMTTIP